MMFSATMPKAIAELSREYLVDAVRVEVSPPGKSRQGGPSVHFVARDEKQRLLIDHLDGHRDGRALVFARTRHGAERLMKHLERAGFARHVDTRQQEPGFNATAPLRPSAPDRRACSSRRCRSARDRHSGRGTCLQLRSANRA